MLSFRKRCPAEISDLAELYLLNRLSPKENREMEEHMLSCSRCMEVLEETEQFLWAFRGAQALVASNAPAASMKAQVRPTLVVCHPSV